MFIPCIVIMHKCIRVVVYQCMLITIDTRAVSTKLMGGGGGKPDFIMASMCAISASASRTTFPPEVLIKATVREGTAMIVSLAV